MNKKIAFLGALLFAGSSVASEPTDPWYAGIRVGATHYSDFESDPILNGKVDRDNLGGGLFLGYNLNDWFALETGYTNLGKIEIGEQAKINSQTLELVGKFTWKATESLDLFAKAGGFMYKTKGEKQLSGLDEKDIDGTLGLGVEHHFTESLSARVEYQFYHNLTLNDKGYRSEWDTHLVALGLVYNWGGKDTIKAVDAPVSEPVAEEIVAVAEKEEIVVEKVIEKEEVVVEKVVEAVKKDETVKVAYQTAQVYFDTSSNNLSKESIEQLQPIIKHLVDHPEATIVAEGHTDSRGSEVANQRLSEKRAKALSEYLMKEFSIAPERISYSGKGETDPIATNKTKEGQAQNRRVSVFSPSFVIVK